MKRSKSLDSSRMKMSLVYTRRLVGVADGIFNERLVAKCFRQNHGIDYDETFSPVIMLKSIRILLTISAYYDYEI